MPAAAAPKAARGATGAKGAKAAKVKLVNGRLVSVHSKTGNPICSQAMSSWVKSRHGGPAVGTEVFKVLAKCRGMAKQNKGAAAKQASGKLAPGRGTWQRSEKAAALQGKRAASRTAPKAAAGAKAPAAPPTPKPSLAEFAAKVKEHAARSPGGWFGDQKVFINHAHVATKHAHGLDLPAFKARLIEAHNARHLELGRGDLFDAHQLPDKRDSSTPHMGADYHFIRVERSKGKAAPIHRERLERSGNMDFKRLQALALRAQERVYKAQTKYGVQSKYPQIEKSRGRRFEDAKPAAMKRSQTEAIEKRAAFLAAGGTPSGEKKRLTLADMAAEVKAAKKAARERAEARRRQSPK